MTIVHDCGKLMVLSHSATRLWPGAKRQLAPILDPLSDHEIRNIASRPASSPSLVVVEFAKNERCKQQPNCSFCSPDSNVFNLSALLLVLAGALT